VWLGTGPALLLSSSSAVQLNSCAASFAAAKEQLQRDLEAMDAVLLSLFDSVVLGLFYDFMNDRKKIVVSVSDVFE